MRVEPGNISTARNGSTKTHDRGFWNNILLNKFSNSSVILLLALVACFFVYVLSKGDIVTPILLLIGLIGIVVAYGVIAHPKFGITVLFLVGYLLFLPGKLINIDFPIGTLLDLLQYLLIIGFFFRQKTENSWKMFKDPVSVIILIWILYNFAEVGNPQGNPLAWLYTIRTTAIVILTYYIFVYQIRELSFIKFLFKLWLILSLICAADAFHQEVFDFSPSKKAGFILIRFVLSYYSREGTCVNLAFLAIR
jgi:hypothetical protein